MTSLPPPASGTPSGAVPDRRSAAPDLRSPAPDLRTPAPDLRTPAPAGGKRVSDRVLVGIAAVLALALLVTVLVSLLIWHLPAPTPVEVPSVAQA